jgi:hypothetical protein
MPVADMISHFGNRMSVMKKEHKEEQEGKFIEVAKDAWAQAQEEKDAEQIEKDKMLNYKGHGEQVVLKPIEIPKEYFNHRIRREPYSGQVILQDVSDQYSFVMVDLSSSPVIKGWPEILARKLNFTFVGSILETRTWLFAQLLEFERSGAAAVEREAAAVSKKKEEQAKKLKLDRKSKGSTESKAVKMSKEKPPTLEEATGVDVDMRQQLNPSQILETALQDYHIEGMRGLNGGSFGCVSPLYAYAVLAFIGNMTGDVGLGILIVIVFLMCNVVTLSFNTWVKLGGEDSGRAFQISRTLTVVPRLAVAGMAALNVFNLIDMILVGMGVEAIMAIATAFIAIADLRHDLMQFLGHFMVTKFIVIEELPGNVFICQKKQRVKLGPSKAMWPEYLIGAENRRMKGLTIVVNCQGLLLELSEPKLRHWESLRGHHKVFQTRTFNEKDSSNYRFLKMTMRREELEREAVEKQAKRQANLDKQQKEKTAAMAELYKAKPG